MSKWIWINFRMKAFPNNFSLFLSLSFFHPLKHKRPFYNVDCVDIMHARYYKLMGFQVHLPVALTSQPCLYYDPAKRY